MPMSDYMAGLRAKIGHDLVEVPTVSILVFDDAGRVLLVRHVESGIWTTPGGMLEPGETPADAALREMWEETGLEVELTQLVGVLGGPECFTTYANGDRIAWVSVVFRGRTLRGTPRPDGEETLEVRYIDRTELDTLPCRAHVRRFLDAAAQSPQGGYFQPPTWRPGDPGAD